MIPGAKFSSWLYRIAYNTLRIMSERSLVVRNWMRIDIAHTDEDLQETVIKNDYRAVEQDADTRLLR